MTELTREAAEAVVAALEAEAATASTLQEAQAVALAIEDFTRSVRLSRWEPYPWQHPHTHPEGWISQRAPGKNICDERCLTLPSTTIPTHGIWKQRGGRGTGKTEGAAHYINAHAEGPPCDTRVPGGHRFTIVAPTQSDAVSSCVEGVSGLKAINPAVTVTTGREGTIVRWPNGSVGRLLGGNTAKDIDRIRAWTNICCVAEGTLVQTVTGPVPIEQVQAGDLVWTRTGLRRVLVAQETGYRPVVLVAAGSAEAWVTPDHEVAQDDGTFARADSIGRKVLTWTEQGSSTPGSSGPADRMAITSAASDYSIGPSMPVRSAPSQMAFMSTTATTTRPTTTRPTWWPSHRVTMPMLIRRTLRGTLRAARRLLQAALGGQWPAGSAARSSSPKEAPPALQPVGTGERRHGHTKNACAACVETGSPALVGIPPVPVARTAAVSPLTRHARVYDLTVEGHHEFYAGGLLVGNCAWVEEAAAMPLLGGLTKTDATAPLGVMDQLPFTLRLGATPHAVVTTTPKNRPEVTALLAMPGPETWGRTEDAYRLEAAVRESLELTFRGTTAGLQELDGEQIADTPGALWVSDRPTLVDGIPNTDHRPGIGNDRLTADQVGWVPHTRPTGLQGTDPDSGPRRPHPATPTIVQRVVIAVDPPGGRTECGIIVVGASGQHGYVLADLSTAAPPDTWARIVLEAYYDFGAEGLAVELTYGGNMVTEVIGSRAEIHGIPAPPIYRMPTKVGKRLRAEPVQGLYQQHRIHHVGFLDGLETEQRTWIPDQTTESPNRIDALVHGVNYLLISARPGKVANPAAAPTRMPSTFGAGNGVARRR